MKLYVQDPYGNGLEQNPVQSGECLPTEDGNIVEFLEVVDSKTIKVIKNNEEVEINVAEVCGEVKEA